MFYKIHKDKFFKDRNWLLREFPEILPVEQNTEEKKARELTCDCVKINAADCFSGMHCLTTPKRKDHCKNSPITTGAQSKASTNFLSLAIDDKEHRREPWRAELFPGSKATFRILEVLYIGSKMGSKLVLKSV